MLVVEVNSGEIWILDKVLYRFIQFMFRISAFFYHASALNYSVLFSRIPTKSEVETISLWTQMDSPDYSAMLNMRSYRLERNLYHVSFEIKQLLIFDFLFLVGED